MVYDLLTQLDKDKIQSYITDLASEHNADKGRASVEHLLAPWNKAKSEYLEKLFGQNLIITKDIQYKEGEQELWAKMREFINNDERCLLFINKILNLYEKDYYEWGTPEWKQKNFVCNLFSTSTLVDNKIDLINKTGNNTFQLTLKDTTITIQQDMKPIRVITKIANSFGIGTTPDENDVTDLEYFRRRHSLALNQKALSGKLCLSIHPLDYMTMSDNSEGWSSCMSWYNDGEYKQGTVEMMNSPCVVVGYLASDSKQYRWNSKETGSWNSKKWRSLFIVDKDFIINIKSYPYNNDSLTKEAIKELAKLSNWGSIEPEHYNYYQNWRNNSNYKSTIGNRQVVIIFGAGAMYNDFGHNNHYMVVNPNNSEDIIDSCYWYSGTPECVWCGCVDTGLIGQSIGEGCLLCAQCEGRIYCECCGGAYVPEDTYITEEGYRLCPYCYEDETEIDPTNQCVYMRENMVEIYLSTKRNEWDGPAAAESIFVYSSNYGTNGWNKLFKISQPRTYEDERSYRYYYVLADDCTELGLAAFGMPDEDCVKDYLGESEDN